MAYGRGRRALKVRKVKTRVPKARIAAKGKKTAVTLFRGLDTSRGLGNAKIVKVRQRVTPGKIRVGRGEYDWRVGKYYERGY